MKGVVFVLVLLIAVPAVIAAATAAPRECNTRLDCLKLAKASPVACQAGFSPKLVPDCDVGKCVYCTPATRKLQVQCDRDYDCAGKITCNAPLSAQCVNNKCICTAQKRTECYTDNDCTRRFLGRAPQRMSCLRGKCIAPLQSVVLTPRAWGRPVTSVQSVIAPLNST
ncbi:MAG: hypothetical protein QXM31_00075 [Candidatus Woesearchaeota archaeon]